MIADVLAYYFPSWEAPADNGREWVSCLCPAHDEDRPSAAVSYGHDAVSCLACGFKGSAYTVIMKKEGVGYRAAIKRAEEITSYPSGGKVQQSTGRKPGRRILGKPGTTPRKRGGFPFRMG